MIFADSGVLFCCAHPSEAKALPPGHQVLVTGVGKVESALALSRHLASAEQRPRGVFLFGVAGVYPDSHGGFDESLKVGDLAWVERDVLADEGVQLTDGFLDLPSLGLLGDAPAYYLACRAWMHQIAQELGARRVHGATVSSCAGELGLAVARAARTGAQVETMEGAAIARVCQAWSIPWVQLRSISNRCTAREQGGWDLPLAIANLHQGLLDVCGPKVDPSQNERDV